MTSNITRPDDGRRHMAKGKCPVCGGRLIDFPDAELHRRSTLCEYRTAQRNSENIDMILTCPNRACGAAVAVCIRSLHAARAGTARMTGAVTGSGTLS
jgi:hypothetical protein